MAACGSLHHIFENPLPETPSWNQINPVNQSSFTQIFGELNFDQDSQFPSSSSLSSFPPRSFSSSFADYIPQTATSNLDKNISVESENRSKKSTSLDSLLSTQQNHQYIGCHGNGDSSSPRNYESLQLCTEGLGSESFDDIEDLKNDTNEDWRHHEQKASMTRHSVLQNRTREIRLSTSSVGAFPPPISCIGKSGKPWVYFKSYRHDGRFILKQVRIPSQELLHAHREDGRLKLHFVWPNDDEILEEDEEGEEEN